MRGLVVRVFNKGRAGEVGVKALHNAGVAEAVSDLLVTGSPELFFMLELYFS